MKTRLYLKHFSKTGISSQFDSEILSYKSTIYLLEQCLRENIVCTRLLPLLWSTDCDRREDEGIKKCVSLKALRILDRRDVETALEIHQKEVQDSIPDEKVGTILVPALEFKR